LQRRGLSLNPITSLYYIAPASFAFLSIPWWFIEATPLLSDPTVRALLRMLLPFESEQAAQWLRRNLEHA
jgi:hypothetical protein